jgi:prolipoprotein diacylglyceryl transferase
VLALLASIPSPSSGVLHLGPVPLRMYGLMLLLAIAVCVWLTRRRWVARGGEADLVYEVALWGVLAGIVGARLYHDATSWSQDQLLGAPPGPHHWWGAFAVWKGGLGIWGGILFGVAAGALVIRRGLRAHVERLEEERAQIRGADEQRTLAARIEAVRQLGVRHFLDAAAPGLLLAQGVGRWGNYWNQELFGKPTSLPWGLKVDYAHCPDAYKDLGNSSCNLTFHPTFLYEFLWNLSGVGILLLLDRRFRFRPPALFALYVAYYTFGRFFEELLRIDPSHHYLGLRLNAWVSLVVFVLACAAFVWVQFVQEPAVSAPGVRQTVVDALLAAVVVAGELALAAGLGGLVAAVVEAGTSSSAAAASGIVVALAVLVAEGLVLARRDGAHARRWLGGIPAVGAAYLTWRAVRERRLRSADPGGSRPAMAIPRGRGR